MEPDVPRDHSPMCWCRTDTYPIGGAMTWSRGDPIVRFPAGLDMDVTP